MKIAILTDSAANLSKEFLKENKNVFVVPLLINIDGKIYRDQVDISSDQVYEKLKETKIITSLPERKDILDTLKKIKEEGYTHIIAINMSSGLSGTYNLFRIILEEQKDFQYLHMDSKTLAGAQAILVMYATELVKENICFNRIYEMTEMVKKYTSFGVYTIDTLKYLKSGGRINKIEAAVGDLLKIKPIIFVNDEGKYETYSKTIGFKRALVKMRKIIIEKFSNSPLEIMINYGTNKKTAINLLEKLKSVLNVIKGYVVQLTPVLGVHTGPDMISIIARRIK